MDLNQLKKMSKEDLLKMIEEQAQQEASGLMVKLNSAQGIYIRSPKFKEWSVAKSKEYTAGINIPFNTAKVLFNDPVLLAEIKAAVNKLTR